MDWQLVAIYFTVKYTDFFYSAHTFVTPSADSRRAVVSYWRKYVHEVLVNRLGGLSLPRKSVVRLTDRPDMTLDVYRGRKTIAQQQFFSHQRVSNKRMDDARFYVLFMSGWWAEDNESCMQWNPVYDSQAWLEPGTPRSVGQRQ